MCQWVRFGDHWCHDRSVWVHQWNGWKVCGDAPKAVNPPGWAGSQPLCKAANPSEDKATTIRPVFKKVAYPGPLDFCPSCAVLEVGGRWKCCVCEHRNWGDTVACQGKACAGASNVRNGSQDLVEDAHLICPRCKGH